MQFLIKNTWTLLLDNYIIIKIVIPTLYKYAICSIYTNAYTHSHTHIHAHTHIHTYTHSHTHTHTYTHIHTKKNKSVNINDSKTQQIRKSDKPKITELNIKIIIPKDTYLDCLKMA